MADLPSGFDQSSRGETEVSALRILLPCAASSPGQADAVLGDLAPAVPPVRSRPGRRRPRATAAHRQAAPPSRVNPGIAEAAERQPRHGAGAVPPGFPRVRCCCGQRAGPSIDLVWVRLERSGARHGCGPEPVDGVFRQPGYFTTMSLQRGSNRVGF